MKDGRKKRFLFHRHGEAHARGEDPVPEGKGSEATFTGASRVLE
jgi:hypothetical protein